jgi:hypothetical protein
LMRGRAVQLRVKQVLPGRPTVRGTSTRSGFGAKLTGVADLTTRMTHLRHWLCPAAIVSVPYQSTCQGTNCRLSLGNRYAATRVSRLSQHRGGLTACGARAVAGKV